MAIEKIDPERCTGCGTCVDSCSMDVIRLDDATGRAVVRYPEDCMLCGWCVVACPENAVTVSPHKTSPVIVSWG